MAAKMVNTYLENVKYLSISKHEKGYAIEVENKKIHVPIAIYVIGVEPK